MAPSGLHVVLGASGGAGNAIARALHESGLQTRGVCRSGAADVPEQVDVVAADITHPDQLRDAIEGADVVHMAAQPPYHRWAQEFPQMLHGVVEACAEALAKLVMVDNLYAYGPTDAPITERTPQAATDTKGATRARLANSLLAAHAAGRVRVTIGRAADYFGPRADNSGITALAIAPATQGKTLRWLGSLDAPHAAGYLPDLARAYVLLGTSEAADGRTWILPHAPAVTGRRFLAMVNQTQPNPLKTSVVSKSMLRVAAPFHRISRESLGILYQWTAPFDVDDSAFQETFGPFPVTPLDQAIADTVRWYQHHV